MVGNSLSIAYLPKTKDPKFSKIFGYEQWKTELENNANKINKNMSGKFPNKKKNTSTSPHPKQKKEQNRRKKDLAVQVRSNFRILYKY